MAPGQMGKGWFARSPLRSINPLCRMMVHSDFKRFLTEAGERLSMQAVYVFTEEGGEIESTDDILHDDHLWISSGEPFVEPAVPDISGTQYFLISFIFFTWIIFACYIKLASVNTN